MRVRPTSDLDSDAYGDVLSASLDLDPERQVLRISLTGTLDATSRLLASAWATTMRYVRSVGYLLDALGIEEAVTTRRGVTMRDSGELLAKFDVVEGRRRIVIGLAELGECSAWEHGGSLRIREDLLAILEKGRALGLEPEVSREAGLWLSWRGEAVLSQLETCPVCGGLITSPWATGRGFFATTFNGLAARIEESAWRSGSLLGFARVFGPPDQHLEISAQEAAWHRDAEALEVRTLGFYWTLMPEYLVVVRDFGRGRCEVVFAEKETDGE